MSFLTDFPISAVPKATSSQRKSNVAVTFTDAQSDGSFLIAHHMLGRANITGQEPRATVEFLKSSNKVTLIEEVKSNNATAASD
jgi:hypothetical protein